MPQQTGFNDFLIHVESQLLIRSVCSACGQSQIVSAMDGSLYRWKEQHVCEKKGPAHVDPPIGPTGLRGTAE